MARYLLDTDAVIDHLFGVSSSVALVHDLHHRGDTLCTCDIVIAEVYAGLRPQHRQVAEQLLMALTFLPTTPAIAQQAGSWRYGFARRGIQLTTTDTLVAATAHGHGAAIVTGNTKDYPIAEITVLPLPRATKQP